MYHSITFKKLDDKKPESKNTWNDWHLIPSTLPVVSQPTPTYKYIDIPGRDGSLDFSDYLIGRPTYSDRTGSFKFYVAPGYGNSWANRKRSIASYLNGKELLRMTLEDDVKYYYVGRFYMKEWSPGANFSEVTIEYRVRPYAIYEDNKREVLI